MSDIPNYNLFNYTIRPAKSIERKIILDSIRKALDDQALSQCSFVSMGSVFFHDFILFRKNLNLEKLINIEEHKEDKLRFIFNRPFGNIHLEWGHTNQVLPRLDWDSPVIIWLDFEKSLSPEMFEDLKTIFSRIQPNSYFIITCNAIFQRYFDKQNNTVKLDEFKMDFNDLVPLDVTSENLQRKNSSDLIEKMVLAHVDSVLNARNGTCIDSRNNVSFIHDSTVVYQDGAKMFSLFGAIRENVSVTNAEYTYVDKKTCRIMEIANPILTQKEVMLLNRYIHLEKEEFRKCKWIRWIPEDHKMSYYEYFKYYSSYIESVHY